MAKRHNDDWLSLILHGLFTYMFFFLLIDDDEVARKISEKLRNASIHGISFCNIAKKAQEIGRTNLAIMVRDEFFSNNSSNSFALKKIILFSFSYWN